MYESKKRYKYTKSFSIKEIRNKAIEDNESVTYFMNRDICIFRYNRLINCFELIIHSTHIFHKIIWMYSVEKIGIGRKIYIIVWYNIGPEPIIQGSKHGILFS